MTLRREQLAVVALTKHFYFVVSSVELALIERHPLLWRSWSNTWTYEVEGQVECMPCIAERSFVPSPMPFAICSDQLHFLQGGMLTGDHPAPGRLSCTASQCVEVAPEPRTSAKLRPALAEGVSVRLVASMSAIAAAAAAPHHANRTVPQQLHPLHVQGPFRGYQTPWCRYRARASTER